jgi:uncharacterized NAD-dependent epimerase/dehydratase family protein
VTRCLLVLTEGAGDPITAKTGVNLLRYCPDECVAVLDSTNVGKTAQQVLGVGGNTPVVGSVADAPTANTLLIGTAPSGGKLPPVMRKHVLDAVAKGLNILSGLHDFLSDDAEIAAAARKSGSKIHDVRKNDEHEVSHRKNIREECLRIHTVGNDCSVGKMVVSLEVARALNKRRHDAKFVATGQTGIMIEGDGCPIDCVVSDFVNGAAERLVLANQHHEIILVEGQGSLVQPRYSGVTLGLLHGCIPDGLIFCYEAKREKVHNMNWMTIPPLRSVMKIYEDMANAMHPCRIIGIGVNTRLCTAAEAEAEKKRVAREFGLPVCDVIRDGPDVLVDAVLDFQKVLGKGKS